MENLPIHHNNNLQNTPEFDTNDLINQFISDTQYLKEASKVRYRKSLKKYFEWVSTSGFQLSKITLTELLIYNEYLSSRKTKDGSLLSKFTIGAYLNAVKIFYEWANGKGLMINPAKSLKSPKREKKFRREPLSVDQSKLLLAHFKNTSIRDFVMCNLMIKRGLRTIEICRLDVEDIQLKNGTKVLMVQGKGKDEKDMFVIVTDKIIASITEYLNGRTTGPIFTSESVNGNSSRLIPTRISKIIKEGLRAIGIDDKKYTAHSLRHTAGTTAILNGATSEQVQDMLRHSDVSTTNMYIGMAKEIKRLEGNNAEKFLDDAFD